MTAPTSAAMAVALLLVGCSRDSGVVGWQDGDVDTDALPHTDAAMGETDSVVDTGLVVDDTGATKDSALAPLVFDDAMKVDVSVHYGCATHPSYGVQCWGSTEANPPLPFEEEPRIDAIGTAPTGLAAVDVEAGLYVAMARDTAGGMVCWPDACPYGDIHDVVDISAFGLGCILDDSGRRIRCNPIMYGTKGEHLDPVGWTSVVDGGTSGCALRTDGTAFCFGSPSQPHPHPPSDLVFHRIAAAGDAICGILSTGSVECFQAFPNCLVQLAPDSGDWREISMFNRMACAIDGGGYIQCWSGDGICGFTAPAWMSEVPTNGRWVSVALSAFHGCAMKPSGKVRCWGNDRFQQSSPPPLPPR